MMFEEDTYVCTECKREIAYMKLKEEEEKICPKCSNGDDKNNEPS